MKTMRKVVWIDKDEFDGTKYIEDLGNFNSLPSPRVKSTFQEFIRYYLQYSPDYLDSRQIFNKKDVTLLAEYSLYFYRDRGYAVSWNREDPSKSEVYRLGCVHEYEEVRSSGFYHEYVCKKCGQIFYQDTSD